MVLCDSRTSNSRSSSNGTSTNTSTPMSSEDASLKLLTIEDEESSNFSRLTVVAAAHEAASTIIHNHSDNYHTREAGVEETVAVRAVRQVRDFDFDNTTNSSSSLSTSTSSSATATASSSKTTAVREASFSLQQQPVVVAPQTAQTVKMSDHRTIEFVLKSLLSGGVAGMCAKTAVAPLDRIKILLQAHSNHYKHLGVFSGLKGIVEKEKFLALYKGNGAQMVRIFPYAATQFTSYEAYKKLFGEKSRVGNFFAGSAAGVTAVALTYPLDTIRARLAFQVSGEHVYNGIYSCAISIFKHEGGVRALYRGFTPTVCGMVPYAGLSFYCFESFKYVCMKYFPGVSCSTNSRNTGGLELLIHFKLLCGGIAGAVAQSVSYPLDVTRRRMQLAMMNESTRKFGMGMFQTLGLIYSENGVWRGLYRGMSINYLRAIPMVAVSFTTYELVKQLLNMDTGLAIKTG